MFKDIGKAAYWIVVFFIAMFLVCYLASSPTMLLFFVIAVAFWYVIDSNATDVKMEEKSKEEAK